MPTATDGLIILRQDAINRAEGDSASFLAPFQRLERVGGAAELCCCVAP
jgi:hypothetical protein